MTCKSYMHWWRPTMRPDLKICVSCQAVLHRLPDGTEKIIVPAAKKEEKPHARQDTFS